MAREDDRAFAHARVQAALFPAALVLIYALLLLKGQSLAWLFACYAAFGTVIPFMVLNVVHDAVHGALFRSPAANRVAARALDLVGASSYIWGRRHVQLHHAYTNIPGWDVDLDGRTVVRLSPTDPLRAAHRYQQYYLPLLYPFYTLVWILVRDFRDAFSRDSLVGRTCPVPPRERALLFVSKAGFLGYIVVVPAVLLGHSWATILLGFMLLQGIAGVLTLLIVLPTHFDETAPFPVPDPALRMPEAWALHQLRTTNDYATDRKVITFLLGALNHHAAHHLFPAINHNFLPSLTPLVASAAAEAGLPYKNFTYGEALASHFRLLKRNGLSASAIFEE